MEQYLEFWWAGDLTNHYTLWGLSIYKINKIFKIAQYFIGLLAIFELIEFAKVFGTAKRITFWVVILRHITWLPSIILVILLNTIISMVQYIFSKSKRNSLGFGKYVWYSLKKHSNQKKEDLIETANKDTMVRFLSWLERNPIPQNVLKAFTFISLVIVSLGELLTS